MLWLAASFKQQGAMMHRGNPFLKQQDLHRACLATMCGMPPLIGSPCHSIQSPTTSVDEWLDRSSAAAQVIMNFIEWLKHTAAAVVTQQASPPASAALAATTRAKTASTLAAKLMGATTTYHKRQQAASGIDPLSH